MTFVRVQPFSNSGWIQTFVAQSSPVFMLYTCGLRGAEEKIAATVSWTDIVAIEAIPTPDQRSPGNVVIDHRLMVSAEEPKDGFGFAEDLAVVVDASLIALPVPERARSYLEWLHGVLSVLAQYRGWDPAALESARQYCLDQDLTMRMQARPKQSPDRRHTARLSLVIDHDGVRTLTLGLEDRRGGSAGGAVIALPAFKPDLHDWVQLRNRLRWTSTTTVTTDTFDDFPTDKGMVIDHSRITATVVPSDEQNHSA